jgi:Arc/MetJ-type ribon-helix-helix transcriptional regulator
MTIALTPEQLRWLEQAVAEGRFASVEEAVRVAVVTLMAEVDNEDNARYKPNLDA